MNIDEATYGSRAIYQAGIEYLSLQDDIAEMKRPDSTLKEIHVGWRPVDIVQAEKELPQEKNRFMNTVKDYLALKNRGMGPALLEETTRRRGEEILDAIATNNKFGFGRERLAAAQAK
jgi:hypothetical protein